MDAAKARRAEPAGGDADWQAKYAVTVDGERIPFELIEQGIRSTHAYDVFQLRAMLAVPYFEKKLYELPESEVTPENILKLADEVEMTIQGMLSPRPLMSVPHILADESAAYYHGNNINDILFILYLTFY